MSILGWIALGLLGGTLAGWLLGQRGRALLACTVVAVLGAILGGFLSAVLLGLDISGIEPTSLAVAALGAAALVLLLRALPATEPYD